MNYFNTALFLLAQGDTRPDTISLEIWQRAESASKQVTLPRGTWYTRRSLPTLIEYAHAINDQLLLCHADKFVEVGHAYGYYQVQVLNRDNMAYRLGVDKTSGSGALSSNTGLSAIECEHALNDLFWSFVK